MDWSKYPLEKLIYFLAALIPGFAALLIFQLANPGSFSWFFALGFFGYRTKLAAIVIAMFVVGYSISALLGFFLHALGGVVGQFLPHRSPISVAVAPWRDPKWRNALKKYLGADAPEDTTLMTQQVYDWRREAIKKLAPNQQPSLLAALDLEKINLEMNDSRWSEWYDQFHTLVLAEAKREWMTQLRLGLDFNFKATALYVLCSAIWVPAIRHWESHTSHTVDDILHTGRMGKCAGVHQQMVNTFRPDQVPFGNTARRATKVSV